MNAPAPAIAKGDTVMVHSGRLRARAVVVARSKATGGLTVELLEAKGAYPMGARLNVAPYECKREAS